MADLIIQCLRLGKPCGYPLKEQHESSDDTDFLLQKIQRLEHQLENALSGNVTDGELLLNSANRLQSDHILESPHNDSLYGNARPSSADLQASFPKALILDVDIFRPLPREPAAHDTESSLCGTLEAGFLDRTDIFEAYFSTAHHSFPILGRKRLADDLANSPTSYCPVVALLLLCMKLLTEPLQPHDPPETSTYHLAKQYIASMESSGFITLPLVQAIVLTAMYEIGHAIHPAAYISIGRAARLGQLLGLHDKEHAVQMYKTPDTWMLCEEERRTWWSVIILDR